MVTALATVIGFALGLASCLALAVVDWAAWVLVLPSRRPGALTAQVDFERNTASKERTLGDPIEVRGFDGVKLAGLWHASNHPDDICRGTVLLIHGFAEDPSGLRARMEALNGHGWNVAALDAHTHGRSEGDRGTFGTRESKDITSWIDTLYESGRISTGSPTLAVWGRSMGAAIATRAAADNPGRIAGLVLEAPYVDLTETLVRVLMRKRVPLPRLFSRLILRRAGRLAGASLANPRPIDLAAAVRAPTLIVHGSDDLLIPLPDVRRLARSFSEPAALIEVPGGGHNSVIDVGGSALLNSVATFLDQVTSGRPEAVSGLKEAAPRVT